MSLAHLEAHLSVVTQKLVQIVVQAHRATEAVKAVSATDLTNLVVNRPGGSHNLLNKIAGSPLGAYLDSLTKLLTDQDRSRTVLDRQRALQIEQILKQSFPAFSVTQFENLLHKVLNDRDRAAEAKRASTPAGTSSGGASSSGVFAFRIVNKNGKPTIDILNDAGAGASSWYKADDPDWLKIQNSLNGIKG